MMCNSFILSMEPCLELDAGFVSEDATSARFRSTNSNSSISPTRFFILYPVNRECFISTIGYGFKTPVIGSVYVPVSPPPATPKSEPRTVAPATVLIADNKAEEPIMLVRPAPIKGAASPPVTPISAPPPIAATLIRA